ncbi:toll-Interleukin receptor [Burkholderia sp. AU16741]|uniref:toll/interleukin-1 receptor domain-containing protein n=1 Tax=unclassified Burkholderia TaxID=2613784 RepID=UPI000B79BB9F|nr:MULTISPECIES: toll/interleukin-1 receptor domain-containing protein [unclassified Burkholderia]MDN7429920.1 TIR domain-containing protein [Burkholderia sp. AU45388]OXI32330.1 toll-Interleukin receptor [Burkholderia sp. AU16741]
MPLLNERKMRDRAKHRANAEKLAAHECLDRIRNQSRKRYDVFLSQTMRDAEIVLGVYDYLEQQGYSVYCDWIESPESDRAAVTPANAAAVREAMRASDTMLFIDTQGAVQSRWMCWELGWFDAAKGHVAILPVVSQDTEYYHGREFLGLYPYVRIDIEGDLEIVRPPATGPSGVTLFESPNSESFLRWRRSTSGFQRPKVIG